jgi:hypothetical protein
MASVPESETEKKMCFSAVSHSIYGKVEELSMVDTESTNDNDTGI